MSEQAINAFKQQLSEDEGLRRALLESAGVAEGGAVPVESLVAFASANGFDVGLDEFRASAGPLSDEQLDGVTGGAAFVKYDGVDGEASDDKHDKWIDVLSIDWGSHKPGGGATRG